MERWYASDHHLGHENIIAYSRRPFRSAWAMDEALLEAHNAVVKVNDHVSFLGDLTMRRGGRIDREIFIRQIRRFNGHKRLYLGNHDHFPIQVYLDAGFEKIYATWRSEEHILFSHIPIHPGSLGRVVANVHGHLHASPSPVPVLWVDPKTQAVQATPYINVCVEQTEYRPITLDEVMARIAQAKAAVGTHG